MRRTIVSRVLERIALLRMGKEKYARSRGVSIGLDCRILSNVVTTEPWLITIGHRVTISSDVRIVTHDGSGWLVKDERGRRYRYARVVIGNDVFVGAGVTILPGVEVGNKVVIGAGSVVTRSVPSGTVVAGVPARAISSWDDFESRVTLWPAESDKVGSTYRERVESILEWPSLRNDP